MHIISKFSFVTVLSILPAIASASLETPSFSCSANMEVSVENGYQVSCDGDYSFDSGVLENDTAIVLRATGMLTIGHQVLLKSPFITLDADSIHFFGAANTLTPLQLSTQALPIQDNKVIFASNLKTQIAAFDLIPEINSGAIQTLGNKAYLGRVEVGSYPLLNGSLSPSRGGTLVLSNANGVIVPMNASGAEVSPTITTSVPEPSSLSLLAMGLFCVGLVVRRKAKQH